jgi:hypothetical protein
VGLVKQMRKTIQFIVLTCAVSWLVAGMAILLGLRDTTDFYLCY